MVVDKQHRKGEKREPSVWLEHKQTMCTVTSQLNYGSHGLDWFY